MQLSSDKLDQHLKQELGKLYTVFGDELLLTLEAVDLVHRAARAAGYGQRVILTVEQGFDWRDLERRARSRSLFEGKTLLELRVPSGKPGVQGARALQAYCTALPDETLTIIILPGLDKSTQASEWFSALERYGVIIPVRAVGREQLPAWIGDRLALQGQHADPEVLQFLAQCAEGNLIAAFQEVQKLGLLFPEGVLTLERVRGAVVNAARYDVFEIGPAVLDANAARVTEIVRALRDAGDPPSLVLWALCEEIRTLLAVEHGLVQGLSLTRLLRERRVWGARQQLIERACRRFSRRSLEAELRQAARIDRMIKGVEPGDVWDELLWLGLRLASPAGAAESVDSHSYILASRSGL